MDKLKSPQHAPNRYYGTLAPPGVTEVITGAGAAIARLIMIDHRIIIGLHKTLYAFVLKSKAP